MCGVDTRRLFGKVWCVYIVCHNFIMCVYALGKEGGEERERTELRAEGAGGEREGEKERELCLYRLYMRCR